MTCELSVYEAQCLLTLSVSATEQMVARNLAQEASRILGCAAVMFTFLVENGGAIPVQLNDSIQRLTTRFNAVHAAVLCMADSSESSAN